MARDADEPSLGRALGALGIALLLAGLVVRFWAIGHARFTGDESFFWATARNIAVGEAHAFYGPALTGSNAYHPGPLFYYLMAVPQRLGVSPWWGGGLVVLLHGLGALLLADVARRTRGGALAAQLVVALWAFAPWDVLYGDRVWLSCVAPIWGAAALWAATRLERPSAQVALVFVAGTMPQLHMSAPIVWVALVPLVVLGPRPRWSRGALALGVVLVVLAYAAPLYNELRTDFQNTRAILREGGGKAGPNEVLRVPLRVFGYALLYATSEIGYHFDTGYWRPFAEGPTYFTAEGVARLWARRGVWLVADVVSIAVACAGWLVVLSGALRAAARGVRDRLAARRVWAADEGAVVELGARMTAAIVVGLFAATALMMIARKGYFPHYTNLFMPFALLPPALGLAALTTPRASGAAPRLRAGGALGLALAVALAMASSTVRYYREVDTLNGLDATWSMVEATTQGPTPFQVRFDGFDNRFAWQMIAAYGLKRPLSEGPPAARYRVHNGAVWSPPPGAAADPRATQHGSVWLEVER